MRLFSGFDGKQNESKNEMNVFYLFAIVKSSFPSCNLHWLNEMREPGTRNGLKRTQKLFIIFPDRRLHTKFHKRPESREKKEGMKWGKKAFNKRQMEKRQTPKRQHLIL